MRLIRPAHASQQTLSIFQKEFALYEDFVSIEEEEGLVGECRKALAKSSWLTNHFDSKIVNYREICLRELTRFPTLNSLYEKRIIPQFFHKKNMLDPHILDLAANGYILPHLDNYCGPTISGLSLISGRIMRFRRSDYPLDYVEIFLPPRSLYWQTGSVRYEYEHEIIPADEQTSSITSNRISIVCRQALDEGIENNLEQ